MTKTYEEAVERYGKIENGVWKNESLYMTFQETGFKLFPNWISSATGKPIEKIYCNRDMAGGLAGALARVLHKGLVSELKTFDGCFCIRKKRGLDEMSTHSYGLAIDINAHENPLGGESKLSPELVGCFVDAGFIWGGTWHRKDPQHFQWAEW